MALIFIPIVLQLSRSLITFFVAFYPNHFRRARSRERTSFISSWLEILSRNGTPRTFHDKSIVLPVSPVSERSIAASFSRGTTKPFEKRDQVEGTDLIIHPWRSGCLQPARRSSRPRLIGSFRALLEAEINDAGNESRGIISEQRLPVSLTFVGLLVRGFSTRDGDVDPSWKIENGRAGSREDDV